VTIFDRLMLIEMDTKMKPYLEKLKAAKAIDIPLDKGGTKGGFFDITR
jgi:hypothetical protein